MASAIISYLACYALRRGPAAPDSAATSGATSCGANPRRVSSAAGQPESHPNTSMIAYRLDFVKKNI